MYRSVDNSQDVLDSRDIITRIETLEDLKDSPEFTEEEREELKILKALEEEAGGSLDWKYGETLIRDSYLEDYAQELALDIGAISGEEKWPLNCIDWERASRELRMDYTSVEFDGVTYWIRS